MSLLCVPSEQLYKKLNTHVALVGVEIWSDKDKIKISSNASFTLENFSTWRANVLLGRKHHDIAQLITYVQTFPFMYPWYLTEAFQKSWQN